MAKPASSYQEFGNKPPSLDMGAGASAAASSKPAPEATSYAGKLEQLFPASKNYSDPGNREAREAMLTMRDCGYDDFDKNLPAILDAQAKGKITDLGLIQQNLEKVYYQQ